MEKRGSFWTGAGATVGKLMHAPAGIIVGGLGALYFAPKILHSLLDFKTMRNTGESADSLKELEQTNRDMVMAMQATMPAAKPKRDTYPYV